MSIRSRTRPLVPSLAIALGAVAAPLFLWSGPAAAQSTPIMVNTTADTVDAVIGDGVCADAGGACSLRAAVQEANASDNRTPIRLGATIYTLTRSGDGEDAGATGDLDITGNIVINGRRSTVDLAGLGDRGFDVAPGGSLQANLLTVKNGAPASGESGGAFRSAGTLGLNQVRAEDNVVSGPTASGGAVLNDGGDLIVRDSTLTTNSSARAGGAIESNAGATTIVGSVLWGNITGSGPGNGGGFHLTGAGTVDVSRTFVMFNTAASEGGGLWNSGSGDMTVTSSFVFGNSANGSAADEGGGGLFNDGGTLRVDGGLVASNSVPNGSGSGGGILNDGGTLIVNKATISDNDTRRAGGGIETVGGTVDIGFSTLDGNFAGPMPGNGGGLHVSGPADVTLNRTYVTSNSASNEGGGLWNSAAGTMTVTGNIIAGNVAEGDQSDEGGGGIFNQGNSDGTSGGTLSVSGSYVIFNSANTGSGSGGGILNEQGNTRLTNVIIALNSSARAGGGIEVVGGTGGRVGTTTLHNVALGGNSTGSSPGNGGGLHLSANGAVTISGGLIKTNFAANEGGGLWNSPSGSITVTGTDIAENNVGIINNGPNLFQKGPVAGGALTVDGTVIPPGTNNR